MTDADLYDVMEATWPPARRFRTGVWTLRDGAGGGKRVAAATATGPVTQTDIAIMEAEQRALGQEPLVMIRTGEEPLDGLLAAQGYALVDPVVFYTAPVTAAARPPPRLSAFPHWPRLAVAEDIWAEGGIGPARLAIMDRVAGPKTAILARTDDTPAGAAFVALHEGTAMVHALEVLPAARRKGTARNMMRSAACWAQQSGASKLALAVTRQNEAARALYTSLGMQVVGQYHYRIRTAQDDPSR